MITDPRSGVKVKIFNRMKIPRAEKDIFQKLSSLFPRLFNQLDATTEVIDVERSIRIT